MSIFDWLREGFGLAPLRDYDLPDEPSTVRPLLRAVDTPPTEASAVPGRVGGPAAPVTPGAAGIHPSQWPVDWRQQLGHVHNVLAELLADHDAGRINLNT